jgi:hypothetical protein
VTWAHRTQLSRWTPPRSTSTPHGARCPRARRRSGSSSPSIWLRTKVSSSVDSRAAAGTEARRNAVIVRDGVGLIKFPGNECFL